MNEQAQNTLEEIKVRGNQLGDRLREIIEEGNARRIIVKKDGRSVMEFPLSVGVGGAAAAIMLSPTVAAIGAFASLATDVRIVIERAEGQADKALTAKAGGSTAPTGAAAGTSAGTKPPSPTDPMAPSTPSAGKGASPAASSTKKPGL